MIRKKSGFLTFCFSFLPGAGQMYMGFMKRGVSLMSAFWLLIFLASWLNLGPLMFAMPVIWFFAFFDTLNLRAMPDDEFYAMEDNYILLPDLSSSKMKLFQEKYRNIIALVLIIIGFAILWNNAYDIISDILPEELSYFMYRVGYYFPQLLIGFAIIAFGLYLIRGKKKDLDSQDKTTAIQDKGGFSI
jgi:hypothetical protein